MIHGRSPVLQALLLSLGPAIGIGIARFAYGMMLPAMKSDLGWTYVQSGLMNTVNALGYLVGAFVMGRLTRRLGAGLVFHVGIFVTVAAILALATTRSFALLSLYRILSGLSGAAIFIGGGTLVSELALQAGARRGMLLSIFYAGPGLGIALTALTVPLLFGHFGADAWQVVWAALGGLSLLAGLSAFLLRPGSAAPGAPPATAATHFRLRSHALLFSGYTIFSAGGIGYLTFMVANLQDKGMGGSGVALFWLLIGLSSMAAPLVWGRVIGRLMHGHAFALLVLVNAVGAVLPLLSTSLVAIALSAAIFGSSFFSVVATTTAFAARNVATADLAKAISSFAIAFGGGQALGPVVVGYISDGSGSLERGLAIGVATLVVGATIGFFQLDRAA